MRELRKDPFLDRWVIVAEERASRPAAFGHDPAPPTDPSNCPFCESHESETCSEVFAVRDPGTTPDAPGWRVRVVSNKYPALRPDGTPEFESGALYQCVSGMGVHDVIIEGAEHTRSVAELPEPIFREVVGVYRDRLRQISAEPNLATGVVIKNVGRPAGASIEHSHSQLIAPPVLPMNLQKEVQAIDAWSEKEGGSAFDAVIEEERRVGSRMIHEGERLVVFCPYAPRFPYETWVLPTDPVGHFTEATEEVLDELTTVAHRLLRALETELQDPPYNYVLHSAPFHTRAPHYRWRLEVLPRVTRVAGFEQATGLYINPVSPERSAERLRTLFTEQ